jgi:hypothetical protein
MPFWYTYTLSPYENLLENGMNVVWFYSSKGVIFLFIYYYECFVNFSGNVLFTFILLGGGRRAHLSMKEDGSLFDLCMFCLFVCHIEISQTMVALVVLLVSMVSLWWVGGVEGEGVPSWFQHNVLTYAGKVIEHWTNFFIENSFKSKLNL